MEITVDEPLLLPRAGRQLFHGFGETLTAELQCYALEEIATEKLRTLLQVKKRLEEGGWARLCARDYYDLWYLFSLPAGTIG